MNSELKVPCLTERQVEMAAGDILYQYAKARGRPVRAPIDVDNILEGFLGLDLVYLNLPDFIGVPDVLGATFITKRRVFIDESLMLEGKEGRLAFTLAHEGGHWCLHRPLIEMEQVSAPLFGKDDVRRQPTILCRASQEKAPAEWQADKFAAALLMPAADVRASVRALCGDKLPAWEGVEAMRRARVLDERLRDFAAEVVAKGNFTNVSNQAMRYRLLDLGLVLDASNPQGSLL